MINTSTPAGASLYVVASTSAQTLPIFVVASTSGSSFFKVAVNGSTTLSSLGTGLVRSSAGSLYNGLVDISSDTNLSVTATGIELSGDAIALTSGYVIPLQSTLDTYSTYAYGSSTYLSLTYASSTFPSFTYASSTFPSFTYNTSTFLTIASGVDHTYASSTFPSFTYASSTYQLAGSYLTTIGSGNNGYSAIWNGTNSLTQGLIRDNGTVAGINATSSTVSFNIQQSGALDPFVISSSTSTNYLTVKANGLVGIGSSSPTATLVVQGTSTLPTTNIFTVASSTGAALLTVASNGSTTISSLGAGLVRSTSGGSLYTDSATYLTSAITSINGATGPAISLATGTAGNISTLLPQATSLPLTCRQPALTTADSFPILTGLPLTTSYPALPRLTKSLTSQVLPLQQVPPTSSGTTQPSP
jgi:hypothetical protein